MAFTDMMQFGLMFIGVVVALPIALFSYGGWSNILALNPEWHLEPLGGYLSWLILGVYAASALTILVEPVFYQRFFAARDHKTAVRAFMAMIILWLFIDKVLVSLGLVAWAKYPGFIITQDQAVFTTVLSFLPVGVAGLFIAGAMAGIMSTVDSYTLVGAANLSYDIVQKIFKPDLSENRTLLLTRVMILFTFALSYGLMFIFPRIMLVWLLQAAILISVALIPIMGAFLWPFKKTAMGGTFSAVAGLITTIAYIAAVFAFGEHVPGWDTIIWEVHIFGTTVHLWAEMVIYLTVPVSVVAYLIGNFVGPPLDPKLYSEGRVSA